METRLRFRVKGWLSEEEFRELLEFSSYLGRTPEGAVFEIDQEKMKRAGVTLRDVYAKLASTPGVDESDLSEIEKLYREEYRVEVYLGPDGLLRIKSRVLLKPYLQRVGLESLAWDPEDRSFRARPHVYPDVVKKLSEQGLILEDKLGLLQAKLPRAVSFTGNLRDYQREALEKWESNSYRGILALPTGS
ncbi:MAG: ATP-dependent helicase, partial [Acidilobaceae archaeon]